MLISRKNSTQLAAVGLLAATLAFAGPAVADGGGSIKDSAPAASTARGVWFSGFDFVTGARYGFDGVIVAFNRDISKDGFALRAYGSRVDFDTDPGNDGRGWQGDLMLGYLFNRGPMSGGLFIGADYQNYALPPGTGGIVNGTEWGFKVAGDLATTRDASQPIYFALAASYSTSFESYWARARYGFNRSRYTFGVEGSAFGNEEFDAQRLGGFLTFDLNLRPGTPLEVTLAAGHQFVKDSGGAAVTSTGGGEGLYGTVTFSTTF